MERLEHETKSLIPHRRQFVLPHVGDVFPLDDDPAGGRPIQSGEEAQLSSTMLLEDEISKRLHYLVTHQHKNLTIFVHPIVYSHLTKGWFSIAWKWRRTHKTQVKVKRL